jgi:sialate O-acetylesterase
MSTLRLPTIFSDHLVLQSDQENPIWGWSEANKEVAILWQGEVKSVRADASGKWKASLAATAPGGPHTIEISSEAEKLILSDVLVGEVWLCSGQSNMEWSVSLVKNAEQEIASAQFPQIRLLRIPRVASAKPREEVGASWQICSPETVREFSGVGYFFGRNLHQTRKVPIGLIDSSFGGSNAETWTEWSFLENEPAFEDFMEPYMKSLSQSDEERAQKKKDLEAWSRVERWKDPGNRGYFWDWAEPGFDDSGWKSYFIPGLWQQRGMAHNGSVWFRRDVRVPTEWAGRDLMLSLGILDDYDDTYFNGALGGKTGNETPNWWLTPRLYKIPARLVRPGETNTLAVRIFDDFGSGGFSGRAPLALYPVDAKPETGVQLAGEWKYRVELALDPTVPRRILKLSVDSGPDAMNSPANLYNGMIAPLVPYGLGGVIWYQGESNAGRGEQYKILFPRLIESWRHAFQNPDLAFFFVLLANFTEVQIEPTELGWAEIREAQLQALKLPRTGYASAIDVGEIDDIHPTDKQSVGERLAWSVRATLFGEKLEYRGPVFENAKLGEPVLRLRFKHAEGLKTRDGGPLVGFAVRGNQEEAWVWAEATIENEDVVLSHPEKKSIEQIRYAWANNPIGNLVNSAGLPADPFRTEK